MAKTARRFLLLILVVICCSCDNGLFGTNLFASFEKYDKPNIDTATSQELVTASRDSRFAQSLTDEEVEKVNAKLKATYNSSTASDKDKAQAALLAGNVQFENKGVNKSLGKINKIITNVLSGEPKDMNLENVLQTIFDGEKKETVAKKIKALLESADAYSAYGKVVNKVSVDKNPGDTAIQAFLSCGVAQVMKLNPSLTPEKLAESITQKKIKDLKTPNYTEGASLKQNLTEALGNDQNAKNIVKVIEAGFDISKIKGD